MFAGGLRKGDALWNSCDVQNAVRRPSNASIGIMALPSVTTTFATSAVTRIAAFSKNDLISTTANWAMRKSLFVPCAEGGAYLRLKELGDLRRVFCREFVRSAQFFATEVAKYRLKRLFRRGPHLVGSPSRTLQPFRPPEPQLCCLVRPSQSHRLRQCSVQR
jgi:hypothetical protein